MKMMRRSLIACWSLFRIRLAESLQYRVGALASGSISVFWGLMEIVVLTIFYRYGNNTSESINGLGLAQAISYVWLGQLVVPIIQMGFDPDIMSKILSGDVGIELCRPLDLYAYWFAKSAAGRLGACSWRAVITLIVALLMPSLYRLQPPVSIVGFVLFLASMVSSVFLCTAYGMLVLAVRLNITWGDGPTNVMMLLGGVLSGTYLPLQLWPDSMQWLLLVQPFAGYFDIPARLYVGSMAPGQALPALALQVFWIVIFIAAGRAVMKHQLKRLIVQGG